LTIKIDGATLDHCGPWQNIQNGLTQHTFTGPGFTDKPVHLTRINDKVDSTQYSLADAGIAKTEA
jgi:hypothetical protein